MVTLEYESGRKLIKLLANFPLAISQAGAYISTRRNTLNPVTSYLELYPAHHQQLLGKTPAAAVWSYRKESMLTTWEISFLAVEERSPLAAKILLTCGYLSGTNSRIFVHG